MVKSQRGLGFQEERIPFCIAIGGSSGGSVDGGAIGPGNDQ